MTPTTTPVDDAAFRMTLNGTCHVVSDLYDLSATAGVVLVKWRGASFVMRVKHLGRNSFAVVLRGHLSTVRGVTTVGYRTFGWSDIWGWGVSAFLLWMGWFCLRHAELANRVSCVIAPVAGVGTALIVGLGRHATRGDGVRMVSLVEQAIAASRVPG